MKTRSFLVFTAAALLVVGGGCDRLNQRLDEKKSVEAPVVVVPPVTKESINLYEAELFLRSRDDVAPGQAEVTNQTLFAKTTSGETVEIVKDVHEALVGKLNAKNYLVATFRDTTKDKRYAYFVAMQGDKPAREGQQLFAFDKEVKKFVELPLTRLTESSVFAKVPNQFETKIAVLRVDAAQAEVVHIADVVTGAVTHKYEVPKTFTFQTTSTIGSIHDETRWADDNEKFQVALFKLNQKPVKGMLEPVEVVVIDTKHILTSEELGKSEFSYDEVFSVLFARPDTEAVSVAVKTVAVNMYIEDGMRCSLGQKNSELPYIFIFCPHQEGPGSRVLVFEKKSMRRLEDKELPFTSYDHTFVFSPTGRYVAQDKNDHFDFFDLKTLQRTEGDPQPSGYATVMNIDPDMKLFDLVRWSEKTKWISDKKFQIGFFNGNPEYTNKVRKPAKTITITMPQ